MRLFVNRSSSNDIDAHTSQLGDWKMRYDQLDRGAFEGGFTDIRWPGMQLFVESTSRSVRQRGDLPTGSFGFGMILAGDGAIRLNGRQGDVDTLIAVHAREIDVCTPPNCTVAGLVVHADLLREAASWAPELAGLLDGITLTAISASRPALAPFRDLLTLVIDTALSRPETFLDPLIQEGLRQELLLHGVGALAGAGEASEWLRADAQKRVVDRACEWLLEPSDQPRTLAQACRIIGASPRKLGYCFQNVLGVSPAQYIKAIRLNAVRRELGHAAGSVYDVAARWGFWHFGHFSSDYKRHFSELPAQTLRRARRVASG